MITRVTGTLTRVLDEEVRLQVGAFEYQVLVPDFVRRNLQNKVGEEVSLFTAEFLEGNQASNKFVPRLVGFTAESDQEFFELFCTVEQIGMRKAMRALARPVRDVADAIQRQDTKWLTTLPGIGVATAEKVVTTLKRKVVRFAVAPVSADGGAVKPLAVSGSVLDDVYTALMSVGHNPADARTMVDRVIASGKDVKTVEEALVLIYGNQV